MSLFNRLLGKKNATGGWVRELPGPLRIDLDRFALGRVKLGGEFADLCFLGPDHNPYKTGFRHDYPDLGISVEQSDDGSRFAGLTVYFNSYGGHVPFGGRFLLNGAWITMRKDTSFEKMRTLFSGWSCEPYPDTADGCVEDARFMQAGRVFEPSWDESGELCDIEMYIA